MCKNYQVEDKVKVKITKIVDFGAFVKLEDSGIDGLIHLRDLDQLRRH